MFRLFGIKTYSSGIKPDLDWWMQELKPVRLTEFGLSKYELYPDGRVKGSTGIFIKIQIGSKGATPSYSLSKDDKTTIFESTKKFDKWYKWYWIKKIKIYYYYPIETLICSIK